MASARREKLLAAAEAAAPKVRELALKLYDHPEIGMEETQAAAWLCETLEAAGFTVERGVAGMPTAFVATWGTGKPVIALIAEYDALPELGHACGHNLIAGTAVLAAIALTRTLSPEEAQVRLVGGPAEETYGGKVQLADHGAFVDVDVALMAHGYFQYLGFRPASGRKSVVIEFFGKAAHAAGGAEKAINALDAMILTFNGMALMRQQLKDGSRVHGFISHGGAAANIIPDYTRAECYVRSFDIEYMEELGRRLVACAQGAAEATGCEVKISGVTLTMLPIKPNEPLEKRYEAHIESLGEVVGPAEPFPAGAGSTDFGNVSQLVPGAHAYFKVSEERVGAHTVEFGAAAKSETGLHGMEVGAKALALTALDAIEDPAFLEEAGKAFADTQ